MFTRIGTTTKTFNQQYDDLFLESIYNASEFNESTIINQKRNVTLYHLKPTALRLNDEYVKYYIIWFNIIFYGRHKKTNFIQTGLTLYTF